MIVAIDGPAGSGKSSTARAVAERLGFQHLDSGAFYRALTWAALAAGIPPEEWGALDPTDLDAFRLEARPAGLGFAMVVGGRLLDAELRGPRVTGQVSRMAGVPTVRDWLLERQRELGRETDLVADGRDVGTVVFPNAEVKVFLVADPVVRARRRLAEQGAVAPQPGELAAEVERMGERDRRDSEREVAPLRRAPDALQVDTSDLTFEDQVSLIAELVRDRLGRSGAETGAD